MAVPQSRSLKHKENKPISSQAHIPNFWKSTLHLHLHLSLSPYLYLHSTFWESTLHLHLHLSLSLHLHLYSNFMEPTISSQVWPPGAEPQPRGAGRAGGGPKPWGVQGARSSGLHFMESILSKPTCSIA